jgi:hypothetical protein
VSWSLVFLGRFAVEPDAMGDGLLAVLIWRWMRVPRGPRRPREPLIIKGFAAQLASGHA